MFKSLYNFFIKTPIYNGLIFILAIIPGGDVGLAVIIITIIVKLVILPISHKSIKAQADIKGLEGEINKIKEKYKDSQEQAVKIMSLYKEHGVNPFSGIFLLFLQIPIILALYFVFQGGIDINSPVIYSFVPKPAAISYTLFYIFDISKPSYILAILVGLTQFLQAKLALPPIKPVKSDGPASFQEEFTRGMSLQTQYFLPAFIAFISYKLDAAISIYWITNNIFSICHELFVKKKAEEIVKQ